MVFSSLLYSSLGAAIINGPHHSCNIMAATYRENAYGLIYRLCFILFHDIPFTLYEFHVNPKLQKRANVTSIAEGNKNSLQMDTYCELFFTQRVGELLQAICFNYNINFE